MKKLFYLLAAALPFIAAMNACKHEPLPLVDTGSGPVTGGTNEVCFQSSILPLFQSNCAKSGCHDAASHQGEYVFDSYANIVRNDIIPGNATNSKVYKVLFEDGNDRMPPPPNTDLTSAQKALIGRWINEGAKNTINCGVACDTTQFKYGANISLIFGTYCLGCHSGSSPSAGINLSQWSVANNLALNGRLVGAVTHAPGYAPMPNGGNKLSECQITQIKKWVAAGAPNN